ASAGLAVGDDPDPRDAAAARQSPVRDAEHRSVGQALQALAREPEAARAPVCGRFRAGALQRVLAAVVRVSGARDGVRAAEMGDVFEEAAGELRLQPV